MLIRKVSPTRLIHIKDCIPANPMWRRVCIFMHGDFTAALSSDDNLTISSFESIYRSPQERPFLLPSFLITQIQRCNNNDNRSISMTQFQQKNFIQTTQIQPTVAPTHPR